MSVSLLANIAGTTAVAEQPEILLQAAIVEAKDQLAEGQLIECVKLPWLAIVREIQKDPRFLFEFAQHPGRFEEFLAATYEQTGEWDEVILTPRSGDRGRDVIVVKRGFGSLRFLEQAKAYSHGKLVTLDDVRSLVGVVTSLDQNCSKGIITTTSDFAPGVLSSDEFKGLMPFRLETRNGEQLKKWLSQTARDGND